jgi:prepilin signal peptidase PulO-like enzyme (type II secretory pathway)
MPGIFLGILGLLFGSFLNVVALRYQPDKFLFDLKEIGGRSHCPHCGKQLKWFELIPLLSFLVQGGLCRSCGARLSFQYPLVELLSGLIFVLVPWRLGFLFPLYPNPYTLTPILWILVFLALLLVALIDLRLRIIPDEINVFLIIVALPIIFLSSPSFGLTEGSFIGHYALLFGSRGSIWPNHFVGLLAGLLFFLSLTVFTWGKGMGGGDVKLAAALGFLFGWPDIAILSPLSFILGSFFALPLLLLGRRKRKDFMPFGPFLVLSSALIFLFGFQILDFYFHLFQV